MNCIRNIVAFLCPGNCLRSYILRGLIVFSLLSTSFLLSAQQVPKPKKPTIGQKVVHFFSHLKERVFKTDSTEVDTAKAVVTTSRLHHYFTTLPGGDSSFINTILQQQKFAEPESTSARLNINVAGKSSHPSIEIFGYHPFWEGDACKSYIPSFLTTLAYFACSVNPKTGRLSKPQQHIDVAVKKSARKTVITLTSFGEKNNEKFLNNPIAQQQLIDDALALVSNERVNGLSIDFEEVPLACRHQFTTFIKELALAMHNKNTALQLSVAVPGIDEENVFDVSELSKYVSYIVVMAYDYYWKSSPTAGPTAPLTNNRPWLEGMNVTSSIAAYINKGVPLNKLLLGIPYYGILWQTHSLSFPSPQNSYKAIPYYEAKEILGSEEAQFDSASMTNYYTYDDSSGVKYQLWFDGPQSLQAKYELVIKNHLGGIAIWCLGYDRNNMELWQTIVNSFNKSAVDSLQQNSEMDSMLLTNDTANLASATPASNDSTQLHPDQPGAVKPEADVLSLLGVTGFKQVVLVCTAIICSFFLLGFLVAFSNNTLIGFFKEKLALLYFIYGMVFIGLILLFMATARYRYGWVSVGGGVTAGVLIVSIVGQVARKRKKIP